MTLYHKDFFLMNLGIFIFQSLVFTCHSVSVHIIDQIDETKNKHWYPSFCEVSTHDKHPMKMSLSWT